jgi:hypothetical protein
MSFVKVIRGHVSFRTRITIPHKHYIKTFKGKVDKRFDNPFWVPTYSAIMVTLRFLAIRGITEKVNFIFDNAKTKEKKLIRSGWDFYKTFAARETKPLIGDVICAEIGFTSGGRHVRMARAPACASTFARRYL